MANIGMVLSGGFAKGAYQIGVLKAVNEIVHNEIKCISSSSIGSLNAYAFATNEIQSAEQIWRNFDFRGFKSLKATNEKSSISQVIEEMTNTQPTIMTDCFVTCLDINNLKLEYINLKDTNVAYLKDYLKASISLPFMTKGVNIAGTRYVDGAIIDNVPISPIKDYDLDYSIVIHFDKESYSFEDKQLDSKLIKINFLDTHFARNSFSFDRSSIGQMIDEGYSKTASLFETIFRQGTDDVEFIHQKVKETSSLTTPSKYRITGDIVTNNMNKVAKKILL